MDKEAQGKIESILVKVYEMALHSKGEQVIRSNTILWAKEELLKLIDTKHSPKNDKE